MLEMLKVSPDFILAYRTDTLTNFFRLFPYLVSDYFYVLFFSIGYWFRPKKRLCIELGFLVPFSAIVCATLKNVFRVYRPDPSLYLISMDHSFGFPSGDVLVGTVFWLSLRGQTNNQVFKLLCFLPIIGIALSRVYLGVHSVYDVTFGFIFGAMILCIWRRVGLRNDLPVFHSVTYRHFWYTIIGLVICYILSAKNSPFYPVVWAAVGALLGFGMSLPWIGRGSGDEYQVLTVQCIVAMLLGLVIVLAITTWFPIIKTSTLLFVSTVMFKYMLIVMAIYVLIPKMQNWFFRAMQRMSVR